MRTTTFEEFATLAQDSPFVPVCKELMADLLTPAAAFLRIAAEADDAFLFESVEGGEHVGRYSFLGKDPALVLRSRGGRSTIERAGATTVDDRPFIDVLRELTREHRAPAVPGLPRFTGGLVGFIGYDAAPAFEPALAGAWSRLPGTAVQDDVAFMLFDTILAFDHVAHRLLVIAHARVGDRADLEAAYRFALTRIAFLERELERGLSRPAAALRNGGVPRSNRDRAGFEADVRRIKEGIAAGDLYQAVLSQRFTVPTSAAPFDVYRALRHVNPSPYMFFLRIGGQSLIGSSPEMLVRVEGRRVETHPIAGTRPRGADPEADERLAAELVRDDKERAEHVMLVDLGRNDLGRVCAFGTVRVPRFMAVERYSHVMHLASTVEGRLAPGRDALDALVACFPAGTVSGAPKIRAMEVVAALEPDRRGVYGGAVGYLDFAGGMDFCIAIRTIVMEGGEASVQAGAGVVADSDPASEYEETRAKARGMLQAIELAECGLGGRGPCS